MYEKIKNAVRTHTEKHRLVFWYDPDSRHQPVVEELEIPARIIEADNNEWWIKYHVLKEKPEDHFLIYIPTERPDDRNNWLLDLVLAGFVFSHDLSETFREEMGLDTEFREFFRRHAAFFQNSAERYLPLQDLVVPEKETERTLAVKMMGILISSVADSGIDKQNFDSILFVLALAELDGKSELWETLAKYNLQVAFLGELDSYLEEVPGDITPYGAVIEIVRKAWELETGGKSSLAARNARMLLQRWRDRYSPDNRYQRLIISVQEALDIPAQLGGFGMDRLSDLTLFPAVDSELGSRLVTAATEEGADLNAIGDLASSRLSTYWVQKEEGATGAVYSLLVSYAEFEQALQRVDLNAAAPNGLSAGYIDTWYRIDTLYRKTLAAYRDAGSLGSLASIIKRLEGRYIHQFLQPLVEQWDRANSVSGNPGTGKQRRQADFFPSVLRPALERGEKLVVIISDALRFEAGAELRERLSSINKISAEIEAMTAALPTVTAVGMNALLPHESLFLRADGTVELDGQQIAGIEGRSKYLDSYVSSRYPGKRAAAYWVNDILRLSSAAARELVSGIDLLYIYSNGIDAAADNAKTESSLPEAVESELSTLEGIVKKIANQLNRSNILITSDHGFLFQYEKPADAFFLSADISGIGCRDRRFVMNDGPAADHFVSLSAGGRSGRGIDSELPVHVAEGLYRIRKQGGGSRYVHGGLSLQELFVPLIRVHVGRTDDVKPVDVSIMIPANTVITTPLYTVNFYQDGPVSEKRPPVQLRIYFAAEDGTVLSDTAELFFDSSDPNPQNRSRSAEFHFSPQVSAYNGRKINLVLERVIGGTTVPYTTVSFVYQSFGERDF